MSDDKDPRLNYGDHPEDELDENGDWDPSGPDGESDFDTEYTPENYPALDFDLVAMEPQVPGNTQDGDG